MTLPLEIDVADVAALRNSEEDFFFLDCREPEEYQLASLPDAVLIPMGELRERLGELEPHRQRRVVVHCHHGGRSLHVAQALRGAGFHRAQSMAGGIDAWSQRIDPRVPRY